MLGALGCVVPEWGIGTESGLNWVNVQGKLLQEGGLDYLANPSLIHAQSIVATVLVQAVLMGLVESYRVNGGPAGDGLDKLHPGEAFDPLGLADDPDTFAELKVKEIKNGARLPETPRCHAWLAPSRLPLTLLCCLDRPPGDVRHAGLLRAGDRHRRGARGQPERPHRRPVRQQRLRVRWQVLAHLERGCVCVGAAGAQCARSLCALT